MATVYKSKIDVWLLVVLLAAMVISLYAAAQVLSAGSSLAWWIAALTCLIGLGFPLLILLSTRYSIEDRQLIQATPDPLRVQVPM